MSPAIIAWCLGVKCSGGYVRSSGIAIKCKNIAFIEETLADEEEVIINSGMPIVQRTVDI